MTNKTMNKTTQQKLRDRQFLPGEGSNPLNEFVLERWFGPNLRLYVWKQREAEFVLEITNQEYESVCDIIRTKDKDILIITTDLMIQTCNKITNLVKYG